jgi:peptidoglycan/LPS O-acetylase OafA/YrhL
MQQPIYINNLTSLRGIAAIWVMLFHMDVIIFYREFGTLLSKETSGLICKGYLWVDFFFLLSGFIIVHVYGQLLADTNRFKKNTIRFLTLRFIKIYPLHLFTLLLLLLFTVVVKHWYPAAMDGGWSGFFSNDAFVQNILLVHSMKQHTYLSWNIVSWSIAAEWWAYMAACLAIPLVFTKQNYRYIVLFVLSQVALLYLTKLQANLDITFDYGWLRCLSSFGFGLVIHKIYVQKTAQSIFQKDISWALAFLAVCLLFHFKGTDHFVIPIFMVLLLSTIWNSGKVKSLLQKKALVYLGEISYSIYMMHGFWFMIFWFYLPSLKPAIESFSPWMIIAFCIAFIACTFVSAILTHKFIEIKLRNYLKSLLLG